MYTHKFSTNFEQILDKKIIFLIKIKNLISVYIKFIFFINIFIVTLNNMLLAYASRIKLERARFIIKNMYKHFI